MDDGTERWRPVVGREGEYEVSDQGRVRSLPRVIMRSNGAPQTIHGGLLGLHVSAGNPYRYVRLGRGPSSGPKVHLLVATAFHGPCPEGMECRHLDGDLLNNAASNLQWGTRSENAIDRVRHGTHPLAQRTRCLRRHELRTPNLTRGSQLMGHRACLACARALTAVGRAKRKGLTLDPQVESDRRYREIMAAA